MRKNGLILCDLKNDCSDAIMLSLSCETDKISKSGKFNELGLLIKENLFEMYPDELSEIYTLPLLTEFEGFDKDPFWKDCELLEDAIDKVANYTKENINIEFYKSLRVNIGRDQYKIFSHVNHLTNAASAVLIYSPNFNIADKKENAMNAAHLVAREIANTNPLCLHSYIISPSILDDVRLRALREAKEQRLDEAADEYATQSIRKFMETTVLDEQTTKSGIKLSKIILDNKLVCPGDFVRFELK